MKRLFAAAFALLCALAVVAWAIRPRPPRDGRTPIVWVCDDNPARREQIALFERTHPDLRLAMDPNTIGMEKAVVQCLAGVGPDVIVAYDGTQLATYARSGIACDLTDRLTSAGMNVRTDFWSGPEPTYMHDGRIYGLPTNAAVDAIWLHKDLFEREGVPLPTGPWKWDEFIALAKRMTSRRADGSVERFGFMLDWGTWQHFVMQWGGRLFNEDGTTCTADSPEAIAATEFMHDLVYRHGVSPTPVEEAAMASRGGWGSAVMTQFAAKKGAMALGGRWWLCLLRDYKGLKLGAVEAPHQARRVHRGYGKSLIINSMSPRREQAMEFVLFMASRDYNELINHQADALGPVQRFAYTDTYLHDPEFPEEDYNEVWRTALEYAEPESTSPFVNGYTVARIQSRQLDLVKNNAKTPAEAMRAVAREVNEEIARKISKDPDLRAKYEAALRRGRQMRRRGDIGIAIGFLLPNLLGFLVFTLAPVVFSLVVSFSNWTLQHTVPFQWTGLENFRELVRDREFWLYSANTIYLMLGMPFAIAGSLFLAILLHRPLRGMVVYRTLFYLPSFTSGVALMILWKVLLNPDFGPVNAAIDWVLQHLRVNELLAALGAGPAEAPKWLVSTKNLLGLDVDALRLTGSAVGPGRARRDHHDGRVDGDRRQQHAALPRGPEQHPAGTVRGRGDRRRGQVGDVPPRDLAAACAHHLLHRRDELHRRAAGRLRAGARDDQRRPGGNHHHAVVLHLHQGVRAVPDRLRLRRLLGAVRPHLRRHGRSTGSWRRRS